MLCLLFAFILIVINAATTVTTDIGKYERVLKLADYPSNSGVEKNGLLQGVFNTFGYSDLPEDFTIYLFDSKPYHPNDWNHGELTLAAISEQRSEIIFLSEDW